MYLVPVLSPSQHVVVQSVQYLVSSPNLYSSEGRSVVPRALVAATEVSGSCLHLLRDISYWLCVLDRKIHSVARLHLLENTVLWIITVSPWKLLCGQEEYSTLVQQMSFS